MDLETPKIVNDETREETERFWHDPENILRLIDLLFLDNEDSIPS